MWYTFRGLEYMIDYASLKKWNRLGEKKMKLCELQLQKKDGTLNLFAIPHV